MNDLFRYPMEDTCIHCNGRTMIKSSSDLYRSRYTMHMYKLWFDCQHCKANQPFGPSLTITTPYAMTFRRESYRHFMGTGFVIFEGFVICFILGVIASLVFQLVSS